MEQHLRAGHLCSALLQHREAPKSKAVSYPQINPSCYKPSPLGCSPRPLVPSGMALGID